MQDAPNVSKDTKEPVTKTAIASYNLDMDVIIGIKTTNGRHDFKVQGELSAPFTLILFALNNITDSLNALAKTKDPEVLHKMTLKDAITPKPQDNPKDDMPQEGNEHAST